MIGQNVAEVIRDHVVLEVEGIDRLYLNGYQPLLQTELGVVGFFKHHRGKPVVSPALMAPMSRRFVEAITAFVKKGKVELVRFKKGERKDEVMKEKLKGFKKEEGVVFVGVAQERTRTFRSRNRRKGEGGVSFPWLYRSEVMCNQYYFYVVDKDAGPLFIKFSSYFPYTSRMCLNGHEYAKRQLAREGIAYEELDNGFLSCADPGRVQEILDGLDERVIRRVYEKWVSRLPHAFTKEDSAAGYRYELSVLQAEFSLTQVFDQPVMGRHFFEEVIRENLDVGRPDVVSLIFGKRVTRRTPGQWRTRVITMGVIPALQVSYKSSKIKQYFKEGRALRTETTINNSRDFGIGRRLVNLPALREVGFTANRRLLGVQEVSHDCMIGDERLQRLLQPIEVDTQRGAALKFGDPRTMALLSALCLFCLLHEGFTNAQLREHVAQLLGEDPSRYSPGRMTYDLRRLKLHGLIRKVHRSYRWEVTDEGMRIALFVTKVYARLLRPGLSAVRKSHGTRCDRPAIRALRALDGAIDTLIREARLAA